MKKFKSLISTFITFCLLSSNFALAQFGPIPMEIIDLKTKRTVGVIETVRDSKNVMVETWKMILPEYSNSQLVFKAVSEKRFDEISNGGFALEIPQKLIYLPAPTPKEILASTELFDLVQEQIERKELLEYHLLRKERNRLVIQGALYREIAHTSAGVKVVRDTWRLFKNYKFPNKGLDLILVKSKGLPSKNVKSFLGKYFNHRGSLVALDNPRGFEVGGSSDPGGDGI
jgi:hypothetical protein